MGEEARRATLVAMTESPGGNESGKLSPLAAPAGAEGDKNAPLGDDDMKPPAGESKETVEIRNRHKRKRLLLLHHADTCPQEEGRCTVNKHCREMKILWKHVTHCKEENNCEVPHCTSSRYILHHYRKCKDKSCPVCIPVKDEILRKRAIKELEEFCGSSELSLDCLRERIKAFDPPLGCPNILRKVFFNKNVSLEIVQYLLESFPMMAGAGTNGVTPLHVILANSSTDGLYDIVQHLIGLNPSHARSSIALGMVPLHVACTNKNIDSSVVRLLVNAWPEATNQRNNNGMLPIHFLCSRKEVANASACEVLKVLLDMNPQAVMATDNRDFLPIYYAADNKSPEFCKLLTNSYPESVRIRGGPDGSLPIHIACARGRVDVVKCLFELDPESITVRSNGGLLPIHKAAVSVGKEGVETIRFLLSKDPDLARKPATAKLLLPLHLACTGHLLDRVQLLFDAHPEAIDTTDATEKFPYDYARSRPVHRPEHIIARGGDCVIFGSPTCLCPQSE